MITLFKKGRTEYFAVESDITLSDEHIKRLADMLQASPLKSKYVKGCFTGPRKEMVSPWSTNAVEIAGNMGVTGISRIERFDAVNPDEAAFDPMLSSLYQRIDQNIFRIDDEPAPIVHITDIDAYDAEEGLALSQDEKQYLMNLSQRLGRPLTDSEVFGFSQVNSEHCRHKIFNGKFIIDGVEMDSSLFRLIKKTSKVNPNAIVSAYKDNVAFLSGPKVTQFSPAAADRPDFFEEREIDTVISLKAETHNFPTTVEPFNGAATGTGGEIRDRMGGGKSSIPIAGTAVYMTAYPRLNSEREWEQKAPLARPWLYQTPSDILIKASNGASDFGNKFGQPLICGSVLTFEHEENKRTIAYDKVIMLAGGIGFAPSKDAIKGEPEPGMKVVVMGGDNYRIGMGGGAVSSVATGQYANSIELNAVQRANPEMQKRVSNVVRALAEMESNPCVSIHDHGAGGHLNALSELMEPHGGKIDISALPIGDNTLSAREIIGNESQERMGLVMNEENIELVRRIAERERAPFFVVGETGGDDRLVFEHADGDRPIDLKMEDMFGNSPKTTIVDETVKHDYANAEIPADHAYFPALLKGVLSLEAVACKDWLTNKVDRSVTGKIARQQCQGELQLPLSDCGVVALDYRGKAGIATSIGHAPQAGLIDPAAGSVLSIAEALTNIAGAELKEGLRSVSLSANWMWPGKNKGEDAALYKAVKACSDFACALGINIPTGKDSLSMTQNYGDRKVTAPGTVIISAAGEVRDIRRTLSPVIQPGKSTLIYIDLSSCPRELGGSALYQSLNKLGKKAPTVEDPAYFAKVFNAIQELNTEGRIMAMHDVSAGGLVVTLLEMVFANRRGGIRLDLSKTGEKDLAHYMFAENPALVLQVASDKMRGMRSELRRRGIAFEEIGTPVLTSRKLTIAGIGETVEIDIDEARDEWYRPSFMLDAIQSGNKCAGERFLNYRRQPVKINIPESFSGRLEDHGLRAYRPQKSGITAAIIREKGINGDREMAYSLYLAGFDVKDVHMTDLVSGRETLDNVDMIVFCGGFSNSDVLGSARGWAGAFKYNERAREALRRFYARENTLSLGICNGCQLMMELELIAPDKDKHPKMEENNSGKFESNFLGVTIPENKSVMFGSLSGMQLGIWIAHGEGKFSLPGSLADYNVVAKYTYSTYPGNPNGSRASVAGICSADGRHLAMMPHLERAIFPWQCGYYPADRKNDELTPWLTAFVNARKWIEAHK